MNPTRRVAILVGLGLVVACSEEPLTPRFGDLRLTVATTGADLDADGYSLVLDGGAGVAIALNDTRMLSGLSVGNHSVLLTALASNCTAAGENPREIEVGPHDTTQVTFAVSCAALSPLNIEGFWDWTEQYVNPVCHDTGTYVFDQPGGGPQFTGRSDQFGICDAPIPGGTIDNTRFGEAVSAGVVAGTTITFHVGANGFCFYTATISGNPPDRLSGTTSCGSSTGTWEAVRGQPVATVSVTPPQATVLEGDTVHLAVQLRDAARHRVFRPVAWSTDKPAVAIVSDAGRVTTGSAGTVTITATAAGATGSAQIVVQSAGVVRVTTSTTGTDADLDGYSAYVDGNGYGTPVAINGSAWVNRIVPGSHTIALSGVASNCTVVSANPVTIAVAGGDTIPVTFNLSCVHTQRIAFTSPYYDAIYVMSADGSSAARLTPGSGTYLSFGEPAWSPDGTRIALRSLRSGYDEGGNDDIYVMNGDGSAITNLTETNGYEGAPAWSPDGTKIAFHSDRDGSTEIYLMNADGSGVRRLTEDPGFDGEPAWSPDGTKLAFESNRGGNFDIYVMNVDGSGVTRLTDSPAFDGGPTWSPDGLRIAFSSTRDGNSQIYVMNVDGSGVTRLTNNEGTDWQPAWSPDGSKIAFSRYVYACEVEDCWTSTTIYVMNADGSAVTQLLGTNTGLDMDPAWRPY